MGANDELRLPDTATLQCAANAVLKSALNKRENVGEKRVVVGDDGEGRDGHDFAPRLFGSNALAVWNRGRLK